MDMNMMADVSALTELVVALEQATLMAKQLPNTTDMSQILQIYSTLHSAHHHLSSFLSQATQQPYPLPQPSLPFHHHPALAAENSVSSAVGNGNEIEDNNNEPMQVGDDDEPEQNSKITIEKVEEGMRDCFIQNKRPKRPFSPSSAERRQSYDHEFVRSSAGFDPRGTRR